MRYFLLLAFIIPCVTFGQKIITDQIRPVSGERFVMTNVAPIYKSKALQVSVMATLKGEDSIFRVSFYHKTIPVFSNKYVGDSEMTAIVVLADKEKVYGKYHSTTEGMGYTVYAYDFSIDAARKFAAVPTLAVSLKNPDTGVSEYSIEPKYENAIGKMCSILLNRIN